MYYSEGCVRQGTRGQEHRPNDYMIKDCQMQFTGNC